MNASFVGTEKRFSHKIAFKENKVLSSGTTSKQRVNMSSFYFGKHRKRRFLDAVIDLLTHSKLTKGCWVRTSETVFDVPLSAAF